MNRTFKSLVLALALATPVGAFAATPDTGTPAADHRGHHRGGHHFFAKLEQHASELGIPQATLDKMKAAFEAARPDFQRLRQEMQQARQSGDQARITAAETAMRDRHQALRSQIDGMLTDQQKANIKQMIERHRAERAQKSGG